MYRSRRVLISTRSAWTCRTRTAHTWLDAHAGLGLESLTTSQFQPSIEEVLRKNKHRFYTGGGEGPMENQRSLVDPVPLQTNGTGLLTAYSDLSSDLRSIQKYFFRLLYNINTWDNHRWSYAFLWFLFLFFDFYRYFLEAFVLFMAFYHVFYGFFLYFYGFWTFYGFLYFLWLLNLYTRYTKTL